MYRPGGQQRGRCRVGDRGSAIAEAAIATVVFMSVLFGVVEFGLAFKDYLSMAAAVRDGTRAASTYGTATTTDYSVIQDVLKRMPAVNKNQVLGIVIFRGTATTSTVDSIDSRCTTQSVSGVCNFYGPSDLSRPSSDFTGGSTAPDAAWPPSSRKDKLSGPPDYIGVWAKINHNGLTGFLSLTKTYTDQAVMRIEPSTVS